MDGDAVDSRFAEGPPEPDTPTQLDAPLRIADEPEPEPEPIRLAAPGEVPAPTLDTPPAWSPPTVDSKRPMSGVGLMAFGGLNLAASSILVIAAMTGPGWMGMSRRSAAIVGGLSIPVALSGTALLVAGSKANKRYEGWAKRNHLSPPATGNGMIVGGSIATLGFAAAAAYGAQQVITDPSPSRSDWAPVVISGGFATIGMIVLAGGMVRRSKFATWERTGYLVPGTMAMQGGGGVTLSGRF